MADTTTTVETYTSIHTGEAIDAAITKIQDLDLTNLEGYATIEYVDNAVANLDVDLPDNIATEEYVNGKVANKVNKAGDTMSGNLIIEKEAPYLYLKHTVSGRNGRLASTEDEYFSLYNEVTGDENNNKVALWIAPETSSADNLLRINQVVDGSSTTYKVYHEGNRPTPASIGAATTTALNNYLPLTGGTVTGQITLKNTTATPTAGQIIPALNVSYQNGVGSYYSGSVIDMIGTANTENTYNLSVRLGSPSGTTIISSGECGKTMPAAIPLADDESIYLTSDGKIEFYTGCANDAATYTKTLTMASTRVDSHVAFYGAVYNDYAEYRQTDDIVEPGRCVVEVGNGTLGLSYRRLEPAPEIVSDTFGFAIGETEICQTPIAVAGRVLAYPYEALEEYSAGDPVCSGPMGTVSKMTREEVCMYPDRMIGTVSEIPTYETWGQDNVKVNGRIWIRLR